MNEWSKCVVIFSIEHETEGVKEHEMLVKEGAVDIMMYAWHMQLWGDDGLGVAWDEED